MCVLPQQGARQTQFGFVAALNRLLRKSNTFPFRLNSTPSTELEVEPTTTPSSYLQSASCRRPSANRALIALACTLLPTLSFCQTLVQWSERALPGDPINIVGSGLTGAVTVQIAQVSNTGQTASPVNASILAQSNGVLQATVPSTLAPGIFSLQVTTTSGTSAPVYINLPQIYFVDSAQAAPGGTINIYGRNLQVLGTTTGAAVQLTDAAGDVLPATVATTTPYQLTVTIPTSAVVGTSYQLIVSNGYGGSAGQVTAQNPIVIQPAGDGFNLGVWWGQRFTFSKNSYNIQSDSRLPLHASGAGTTEDLAAVQAAINYVNKAGGGMVYLPTGTYRIGSTTTGLCLLSNVVLKGDGPGKTILQYGYGWTPTNPPSNSVFPIRAWWGQTTFGMQALTVQNLNTSPIACQTIDLASNNSLSTYCFISNCDINLGNGQYLYAECANNILLQNSSIETTSTQYGPIQYTGTVNASITHNTIRYLNGKISLQYSTNEVVTGNMIYRNNLYMLPSAIETGCIEASSSRLAVLANNTFNGQGALVLGNTGGWFINCQRSGTADEEDLGPVTSATSTTLTNSNANWVTNQPFTAQGYGLYNRAVVSIVAGTGAGQWSYITSNTSNTLTLAQPWAIVPDATSTYSIGWWAADRLLILNNNFNNGISAVWLWEGANQCVMDGNKLVNSGDLLIRGTSILVSPMVTPGPMKGCRHTPVWDNWISNNQVTNTTGFESAKISVYGLDPDAVSRGSICLNTEIRSNRVNPTTPNTFVPDQAGYSEGYYALSVMYNHLAPDPYTNFGVLLLYNTAPNVVIPITTTGSGLVQVVTGSAKP